MNLLKNLNRIISRSRITMIPNILGLSIAFATFLIIAMQIYFDSSFDSYHQDAERIYRIELEMQSKKLALVSRPITEFIAQSPIVETSALASSRDNNASFIIDQNGVQTTFNEKTRRITPSFTNIFHFDMFDGSDKVLAQPDKILIPKSMAQKFFGNESAIGKQIVSSSVTMIVGGVYKDFPENSSIKNVVYSSIPDKETGGFGQLNYNAYIKIGASDYDLNTEITKLQNSLSLAIKENEPQMPNTKLYLTPLKELHYVTDVMYDDTPKSSKQTVFILITIALAIIAVGGINYINFNMALLPMRVKTISINKILGATSNSVRINYILESVFISIISFIIALFWVLLISKSYITSFIDADTSLWANPGLVFVTLLISVVIGVLAGLYPSHYITSFQPAFALKGTFSMNMSARTLKRVLIGIQFLTASVLIMCAWFMYLQSRHLQHIDAGYNKEQVILVDLNSKIFQSKDVFTNQLKSVAGIDNVTYASEILSSTDSPNTWSTQYNGNDIMFHWIPVDPSFMEVMGIKISEGRNFTDSDRESKKGKYIFNEKAKQEFGLTLNTMLDSVEIVAFIPDIQYTTFRTMSSPMAFYVQEKSASQNYIKYAYIRVKAENDMGIVMDEVQSIVKSFETDTPLKVSFYDELFNNIYENERNLTILVSLFSFIAIFISIIGVLGLVFFETTSRFKEVGIRKVLGSSELEVMILFNKSYLTILFISLIIACPIVYYGMSQWMKNFSHHTPMYWWVFLLSGLFLAFITIFTVSSQSWKSATSNPLDAIQS